MTSYVFTCTPPIHFLVASTPRQTPVRYPRLDTSILEVHTGRTGRATGRIGLEWCDAPQCATWGKRTISFSRYVVLCVRSAIALFRSSKLQNLQWDYHVQSRSITLPDTYPVSCCLMWLMVMMGCHDSGPGSQTCCNFSGRQVLPFRLAHSSAWQ